MAAGLQLKNYLTSKTPEVKIQCQQRWLSMEPPVRDAIKAIVSGKEGEREREEGEREREMEGAEIEHGRERGREKRRERE